MFKKNQHNQFFGARSFLLIHIQFTPNDRPKGFVNRFVKKLDDGSQTMKSDHGKGPPSMVRLHGPCPDRGSSGGYLQMNRLKFETAGKSLIILEEFTKQYTPTQ